MTADHWLTINCGFVMRGRLRRQLAGHRWQFTETKSLLGSTFVVYGTGEAIQGLYLSLREQGLTPT